MQDKNFYSIDASPCNVQDLKDLFVVLYLQRSCGVHGSTGSGLFWWQIEELLSIIIVVYNNELDWNCNWLELGYVFEVP